MKLIEMLSADTNIGTIASDFAFTIDKAFFDATASDLKITDDRLRKYRKILKSTGAKRIDRNKKGTIYFMYWASGFGGSTHGKGIAWIPKPSTKNDFRQFVEIKNNWYLYEY